MAILTYPFDCFGNIPRPLLIVKIDGFPNPYPALIDTGADFTIFPEALMQDLGHSNKARGVQSSKAGGFGGNDNYFIHTLSLCLLDVDLNPICKTGKMQVGFADRKSKIDSILIGRDIICGKWRRLIINPENPDPRKWLIQVFT